MSDEITADIGDEANTVAVGKDIDQDHRRYGGAVTNYLLTAATSGDDMADGRYALAILEQIDRRVGRIEDNSTRMAKELVTARSETTQTKGDIAELRRMVQVVLDDRQLDRQKVAALDALVQEIQRERVEEKQAPIARMKRIQTSTILVALIIIVFLLAAVVYALIDKGQSLPLGTILVIETWRTWVAWTSVR